LATRRPDGLQALARTWTPARTSTGAAKVLPDSLLGKTFEWDTTGNHYVITNRAGAPSNGVRLLLYALANDTIAEPVSELGVLDLVDLTSGNTRKARILLAGVGGNPVYYDNTSAYTRTWGSGDTTGTLTAVGFVANGAAGTAYRKLSFTSSSTTQIRGDTGSTRRLALNMSLDQPALVYSAVVTTDVNPSDTTSEYDLNVSNATQSLRALLRTAYNANGRLVTLTVYSNGHVFAQLQQANGGGDIWTDDAGELLGADDIQIAEAVISRLLGGFGPLDYFVYGGLGLLGA